MDSILNADLTRDLANEGMARVAANTNEEWREAAYAAVIRTSLALPTFTADDVWVELDRMKAEVHNKSALGPVFVKASKDGYITGTGAFARSTRPATHGKPLPIWRKK